MDPAGCQGPYWNESLGRSDGYALVCRGWLDVPVSIPADGDYRIEVVAYQQAAGDEPARLGIVVESDIEASRGAKRIRRKLVELHEKLLGVTVTADSPDVDAAFQLFVEVWEREREYELEDYEPDRGGVRERTTAGTSAASTTMSILKESQKMSFITTSRAALDFNWDRVGEILDEADFRMKNVLKSGLGSLC